MEGARWGARLKECIVMDVVGKAGVGRRLRSGKVNTQPYKIFVLLEGRCRKSWPTLSPKSGKTSARTLTPTLGYFFSMLNVNQGATFTTSKALHSHTRKPYDTENQVRIALSDSDAQKSIVHSMSTALVAGVFSQTSVTFARIRDI